MKISEPEWLKQGHKDFPLVEIVWHDSSSNGRPWSDWQEIEDFHGEPCVCVSVGYLAKSDKTSVTVTQSRSAGASYGHALNIPRAMILKIRRLKRPVR